MLRGSGDQVQQPRVRLRETLSRVLPAQALPERVEESGLQRRPELAVQPFRGLRAAFQCSCADFLEELLV